MTTKNEALLLNSGINGEITASVQALPVVFTRILIGDANGAIPTMDKAITALVNEVAEGQIVSHVQDPDVATQRIVTLKIPPNDNYNAVELLLMAKYGEIEFAHTYIRLAAPFPVRTPENGGNQATLKQTIAIADVSTDFAVHVLSDLTNVTQGELAEFAKGLPVNSDRLAIINKKKLHVFTAQANLQIPSTEGELFYVEVLNGVDLKANKCTVTMKDESQLKIGGVLVKTANIVETGRIFAFKKIEGVWCA